jgi:3-oxoacyl-[acyl-carrier protein] reductase
MSSVTGHRAHHYLSAYGMTKAGLEMLAKALIAELAPLGIRVNTVAPGATLTERTLSDEPDYNEKWQPYIPDKRPATPLDIANAALFLLSPKAAHINGQTILVDGGWTSIGRTPDLSSFQ